MTTKYKQIDLEPFIIGLIKSDALYDRKGLLEIVRRINRQQEKPMKSKDLNVLFRRIYHAYSPTKTKSQEWPTDPIRIDKLLETKHETKWIIRDLLPDRSITILSGDPGSFKTWSTLHFAISIASGGLVYDHFQTIKNNVLIIDEEDGIALLQQRLLALSADKDSNIFFMIMTNFKCDNQKDIDELKRHIKRHHIGVIIMDSLIRIHSGEENNAKDIAKMFEVLRYLTTLGVTILINHHHRKRGPEQQYDSSPMRGSGDILAAIDCHLQTRRKGNVLQIIQTKNRFQQEIKSFSVELVAQNDKMAFLYLDEIVLPEDKTEQAEVEILKLLKSQKYGVSRKDIDHHLNGLIGENNIGKAIGHLVSKKLIDITVGPKGKKTYTIHTE